MRKNYGWCEPLSEATIKEFWNNGILTLDTNVLLDLYRYHDDTRLALTSALGLFRDRIWLSHQTAEEFFRNRKRVIVSASNSFADANRQIDDIRSRMVASVESLKGNRIIPDQIAHNLSDEIGEALLGAQNAVKAAQDSYPNYLREDPILEELFKLFDKAIGDPFTENEQVDAVTEAKRRIDHQIPPGFLDADKSGDRSFGDYFMWRQLLGFARKKRKPIIFVTSERKEDWWEKVAGRFTGLHFELQKEMFLASGHTLLAYRTDRFLEFAAKNRGEVADDSAVQEIREVAKARAAAQPAVRNVSQTSEVATDEINLGTLRANVGRDTHGFTCTGHFNPNLANPPLVTVQIVDCPIDPAKILVSARTGTTFDFNIHVHPETNGDILPAGDYVFEYIAVSKHVIDQDDDTES